MPALAQRAAIPPPMIPDPITATFSILLAIKNLLREPVVIPEMGLLYKFCRILDRAGYDDTTD